MENKVALVTGAYRGLGLETVKQLAQRQYTVILTGRNKGKGEAAVAKFSDSGYNVEYQNLDITDDSSIANVVTFVKNKFGVLHVLINNAAIHYDLHQSAIDVDFKIVREAIETNLIGSWKISKAFTPLLIKSGTGRIVNVSSGSGSLNEMGGETPAYAVTKAGLNVLTIKFAEALKDRGVLVNSVCPGWVRTEMGGSAAPRSVEEGASGIVWAATLLNDDPTGGFFRDGKKIAW